MRRRDERGAGTVLTAVVLLGLCLCLAVGLVAVGWMSSRRHATQVADLAALAGAQAFARGDRACPVATEVADRNEATVTGCATEGERSAFVVRVEVQVQLRPHLRGAPGTVTVTGVAGSAVSGGG
ncbi:Rv3654c family TadE-like protein [Aestuariimicrobium ganziense]|uniref:Rv3654c family TadE-like protein n=1 Tax=Aestuariimicrobium ganziense TaxID=2773677 RepID=UPI0019428B18|nr:Rv3654c family TadE-like protein [Aestuariimicrobium ganziense]